MSSSRDFIEEIVAKGKREELSRENARSEIKKLQKQAASRRQVAWRPLLDEGSLFRLRRELSTQKLVGLFAPKKEWDEAEALETFLLTLNPRLEFAYPRCEGEELHYYKAKWEELEYSETFSLMEPVASPEKLCTPELLFVPGLLADLNGNRIGRGMGFYDRYLSKSSSTAVLVLHEDYCLSALPETWIQEHDQKVAALLTSKKFTQFSHKEKPQL